MLISNRIIEGIIMKIFCNKKEEKIFIKSIRRKWRACNWGRKKL